MGKKNDYAYVEGVGLFKSREAATIYDYVRSNQRDGITETIEWTQLRDALFGQLGFMEHDDFVLFKIEVLNPSLAEIQTRTGDLIEIEDIETAPGADERMRFILRKG